MISLKKAGISDAALLYEMQRKAFLPLLERYRDCETNPAAEDFEKTLARLQIPGSEFFLILLDDAPIGGLRTAQKEEGIHLGPIFVLEEYQGKGYAQQAMKLAEEMHPEAERWFLDTIKQEPKLCHLYEKAGYRRYGEERIINESMTLVNYEKNLKGR